MAAKLRDEISKLEAKSLTASAKAQLNENVQYAFRLGQKLRHKKYGMQFAAMYDPSGHGLFF